MNKIVVIVGQTASGKSNLAVKIAQKFNGEIVSADSRQVYKGLDIGSGKITKKEMKEVPHYLLDIKNPKQTISVAEWKQYAEKAIEKILAKKKIPIICGGTGFYIQAIVDNLVLPEVEPNKTLRGKLERKTLEQLQAILRKLDPKRFNTIDLKNPRRLIRAIEIAKMLGSVPELKKNNTTLSILQIGIKTKQTELREKIEKRLYKRIEQGMINEVEKLHEKGVSWKQLENFGLEYRYVASYLQKKIEKEEMIKKLLVEIYKYSKRQQTWFKKDKRIVWFNLEEKHKIENKINKFLNNK